MARFGILHKRGFSWEHFSPEINAYGDDVKEKCKRGGVFFWADRELYIGLGFNTKVVPVNDAPKNYAGLLDPKWKGKVTIAGGFSDPVGGHISNTMGREFVKKFSSRTSRCRISFRRRLPINQVVSGEVPLSRQFSIRI